LFSPGIIVLSSSGLANSFVAYGGKLLTPFLPSTS